MGPGLGGARSGCTFSRLFNTGLSQLTSAHALLTVSAPGPGLGGTESGWDPDWMGPGLSDQEWVGPRVGGTKSGWYQEWVVPRVDGTKSGWDLD